MHVYTYQSFKQYISQKFLSAATVITKENSVRRRVSFLCIFLVLSMGGIESVRTNIFPQEELFFLPSLVQVQTHT